MRVEKPSNEVFPTEPQHDQRSVEASEETSPDVGVTRARAGTERGWAFEAEQTAPEPIERTIVGPPPPAPRTEAAARPVRRSKPRRLVALPSLQLVRAEQPDTTPLPEQQAPATVPAPKARYATATSEASELVHTEPAVIVDEGWTMSAPPARPRLGSQRLRPAARANGANGFPRSAAERAGAAAQGEPPPPEPAAPLRVSAPRLPDAKVRSPAPRLAQGSVTAPLPDPEAFAALRPARRRPPTVEFPTLDDDSDLEQDMDPPSDYTLIDPTRSGSAEISVPRSSERPLPSIYSVVDRRRAPQLPRALQLPAVRASAPAPAVTVDFSQHPELDAVPEPIAPEVAPAPRSRVLQAAPRHAPAVGRSRPGVQRRASSRLPAQERPAQRAPSPRHQSPAFSEAEAAFFAAGEELENADPSLDDELEVETPRPTLWRRLTGRHARLRR